MKKIVILGSTGSIGTQTLAVVRQHPAEFKVVGLSTFKNKALLEKQAAEFKVRHLGVGEEDLVKLATLPEAEVVVVAVVGAVGLKPTLAAIRHGKKIALATKEVMVLAGDLVMSEAKNHKVEILPIDSEHSAIFQSLRAGESCEVEKIILTCSGGPFLGKKRKDLEKVTVQTALAHPTWKMGPKITIDSATLMNKGLEVIEARWFFGILSENIEVVVHPQSILHSGIYFRDGSFIGQMSMPDMRLPIQYALFHPKRPESGNGFTHLFLTKAGKLTFLPPDLETFSCLTYAYEAIKTGGTMPAVLNAANEVAVDLFLKKKINFLEIPKKIKKAMERHKIVEKPDLEEIFQADLWARKEAADGF